jgi:DNA-binding XRE family transcriptional regulator
MSNNEDEFNAELGGWMRRRREELGLTPDEVQERLETTEADETFVAEMLGRLKQRREELGLTFDEVGKRMGITGAQYEALETDRVGITVFQVQTAADVLETSFEWIAAGQEPKTAEEPTPADEPGPGR